MDEACYVFGSFRIDGREHSLTRNGEIVPLKKKVFETLLVLVERTGHLVTRDELMKLLWPDSFVADSTLSQNVWLTRKALGKSSGGEDYIETVPRLGYRFTGDVKRVESRPVSLRRSRMRCRLLWGRKRFPLKAGETLIGRDPEADVYIDNSTVSRRHARILVTEGTATVEDLGSKNATYLRGAKLETPAALADGDSIRVGSVPLVFRLTREAGSTRTHRG
jgi:DNA-binding winged helix-turn-helix (wHTH) protein